ncbi:MAG TPA: amidohydrolase family protein, partial [Firmicutes bacterium]|nr:amidohydrolase family protein [Bacillota bacterium]
LDFLLEGGAIAMVGEHLRPNGPVETVEAGGRLLIPGLVDAHVHLDKALIFSLPGVRNRSGTLSEAIAVMREVKSSPAWTVSWIKDRARQILRWELEHGATAVRSHVDLEPSGGLVGLDALLELREEVREWMDLQVCVLPPGDRLQEAATRSLVEEAVRKGADLVGGSPHQCPERAEEAIAWLFDLAGTTGKAVDLHTDETDDPSVLTAHVVAREAARREMQGRVTASHLCSLDALGEEAAAEVAAELAGAGVHAVALPPANLFLRGRGDDRARRRGMTRVHVLKKAGVNVAFASDNIRDPFCPYGNGDPLEVANLGAQVAQFGTERELTEALAMVTYRAAGVLGLGDYGLAPGCRGDVVLLDCSSPVEAVLSHSRPALVVRKGKVVVRTQLNVERLAG